MSNITNTASTTTTTTEPMKKKNYMTIWVDGCFDMMHFGHANAIRQAKTLYPRVKLICGVHTDEEIARHKGPTVMKAEERYAAVRACKWVDQVVEGAPYTTQVSVLREYGVDFCVHGEDISFDENGEDTYKAIKDAGLMKTIKRTEGVSSTDIVNRMLRLAKYYRLHENDKVTDTTCIGTGATAAATDASNRGSNSIVDASVNTASITSNATTTNNTTTFVTNSNNGINGISHGEINTSVEEESPYTKARPFLPTAHKIWQFANPVEPYDKEERMMMAACEQQQEEGKNESSLSELNNNNNNNEWSPYSLAAFSTEGKKIIYVDGAFDMFHVGHSDFLEQAKKCGDYLIVGVHDDNVIREHKGPYYPIMNLHERVLSVLSCKWVDDVVIGAPFIVTKDLLDSLKVDLVVSGSSKDGYYSVDPYQVPRALSMYKCIPSPRPELTTTTIIKRIIQNQQQYENRNLKKTAKELMNIHKYGHKISEINRNVISN
jgi:ethanolamine-phosphate cytidylyltransferase